MRSQALLFLVTLILVLIRSPVCTGYKMLLAMTSGSKSHLNFYGEIVDTLAKNGHQVTLVSPYERSSVHENVTQIVLRKNYLEKYLEKPFETTIYQMWNALVEYTPEQCVAALTQAEVVEAMKEDYDAVLIPIYLTDCFLGYVYERKVPLIYLSANSIVSPHSEKIGLAEFPSVTPHLMFSWTYPFTFMQRVALALSSVSSFPSTKYSIDQRMESMCRDMELWSDEIPPIEELQLQGCFLLINSIRALEIPVKLIPPTIFYAGGIHIKKPKPLPQDLEDWFEGSGEDGVILFSLGTVVKPSEMKNEHLQIIVNVFRSLKQRVIWKWGSQTIENLPPNVKLVSWLPQQDILAHPKTRLFITHGGLFSTQEATYFSVPVIGMPVFADQANNIAKIAREGCGRQMLWDELAEEKFRNVILETLTNDSLHETVAHKSILMKDWPTKPSEEVNYWIEYVIRHKGAKHLQSPLTHLPWYQIYNVDVWIFVTLVILLIFIILILFLKTCFKFCFRKLIKKKLE